MEADMGERPTKGKDEGPAKLPAVHKTPVAPPNPADAKFLEAWNKPHPVVCPYKLPDLEITVLRSGSTQEEILNKPANSAGSGSQASKRRRRGGGKKKGSADDGKQLDEKQTEAAAQLVDSGSGSGDGRKELDHNKKTEAVVGSSESIEAKVDGEGTGEKTGDDGRPGRRSNASALPLPLESGSQDELKNADKSEATDESDNTKRNGARESPYDLDDDEKRRKLFLLPIVDGCGKADCICCIKSCDAANRALDIFSTGLARLEIDKARIEKRYQTLEKMYWKLADERAQLVSKIEEQTDQLGPQSGIIRAQREKMKELKRALEKQMELSRCSDIELFELRGQIEVSTIIMEKVQEMQADWIKLVNLVGEISQTTMIHGDSKNMLSEEAITKLLDRALDTEEMKSDATSLINVIQSMRQEIETLRSEVDLFKSGKSNLEKKDADVSNA